MSERLHCDPGFRQLLAQHFALSTLEKHSDTIYGLWPNLTLAYMNPAWFAFARDNQGEPGLSRHWTLGKVITEALPDVLHPYYVEFYLNALNNSDSEPLKHEYECSSSERYRRFDMYLYNLGAGAGLLVINHERDNREHWRSPARGDQLAYRQDGGYYRQCSHCRCYENGQQQNRWDWVPEWVARPPGEIEFTLCPSCFNYYYSFV